MRCSDCEYKLSCSDAVNDLTCFEACDKRSLLRLMELKAKLKEETMPQTNKETNIDVDYDRPCPDYARWDT